MTTFSPQTIFYKQHTQKYTELLKNDDTRHMFLNYFGVSQHMLMCRAPYLCVRVHSCISSWRPRVATMLYLYQIPTRGNFVRSTCCSHQHAGDSYSRNQTRNPHSVDPSWSSPNVAVQSILSQPRLLAVPASRPLTSSSATSTAA